MPNDIKIEAMNNTVTALVVLSATALGFCILGCVSFCLQQITGESLQFSLLVLDLEAYSDKTYQKLSKLWEIINI